jgi:hypothetical protein
MTARHRQAPDRAEPSARAPLPPNGSAPTAPPPAFRWDDWFETASPAQRAEALALAREQGLLYLHQLPAPAARPAPADPRADAPDWLPRLLAGKADDLPAFTPGPLETFDADLDGLQREAVARALATPDVCLIHGLPGTGKSRVVAELLTQAGHAGLRVLFVANRPAALDVVLRRVLDRAEVFAVRYLGPDETLDELPDWVRGLTLAEQQRAFRNRALDGARRARARCDEQCRRRERERETWPALREQSGTLAGLGEQERAIAARIARLPAEVERDPSPAVAAELAALARRFDEKRDRIDAAEKIRQAKCDACDKELADIVTALADLEPMCRALQEGGWWTRA